MTRRTLALPLVFAVLLLSFAFVAGAGAQYAEPADPIESIYEAAEPGTEFGAAAEQAADSDSEPGADTGPAAEPAQTLDPLVEIVEPDLTNPFTWAFRPLTITVPAGTPVTWFNRGVIGHTVTAQDQSWDSDILLGGGAFQRAFDIPGEVAYFCRIHPWATGTVVVVAADGGAGPAPEPAPMGEAATAEEAAPVEEASSPTGEVPVEAEMSAEG
ncbi:MAG: hypothetical protein HY332_24465 [Chloroflexi bacterium]|nr:hypothetical protein [Chloroflexota bacterium]